MNVTTSTRRIGVLTAAAAVALAGAPAVGAVATPSTTTTQAGAASDDPFCGIWWGSQDKITDYQYTDGTIGDVRAGRHDCFDRLVIDLDDVPGADGDFVGYQVKYVDTVLEEGSGREVPLRGGASLQITLQAPAYDQDGRPTYDPVDRDELVPVAEWDTFRQAAWAGSLESQTTIGLGVRAHLPFRVFLLEGPDDGARMVVDVAHQW